MNSEKKIGNRTEIVVTWLVALVVMIVADQVDDLLGRFGREFPPLDVASVIASIVFFSILVYWIFKASAFILRKLFWRVGRRLALSYFLVGCLPFLIFAILIIVVGYSAAGIVSAASLRAVRENWISRITEANVLYVTTGSRPPESLASLEIYDSRQGAVQVPDWLRSGSFSGLVSRDGKPVFVSSRTWPGPKPRLVVLAQPLDPLWIDRLERDKGMIIAYTMARVESRHWGGRKKRNIVVEDEPFDKFFPRILPPRGIIWGEITPPLRRWENGEVLEEGALLTLFSNPLENLRDFYFGSPDYLKVVAVSILALTGTLLFFYLLAAIFAGVMIFSISRAVNRIEKGTRKVEQGDFSYRIRMKPHNQLGEVAQSFDRMTESLGTLVTTVAEKERLQSEVDIAASIQRNLLPREGPRFRGISFSAHFEPTAEVGGDYYDVFNLDGSRLAVAIGDVSGHGLSTGLVMAMVKAAITTLVEERAGEASIFKRLNELVFRSTESRAFMTLGFTLFDFAAGKVRHTNAGHLYPYRLRDGEPPLAIESPSLPLGVRAAIEPVTVEIDLLEGDTLVYLSDGIIEAQNIVGEPFGFDQLERLLSIEGELTPAEIQSAILSAVAKHCGGFPSTDDRTIMILRFDQLPG